MGFPLASGLMGFDTETTGVDVENDRIVTAALFSTPGYPQQRLEWLLNPGVDIPEAATAIHGITTQRAREDGQDPHTALNDIRADLYSGWAQGRPLVVFNAPYDLTLFDRELTRHNLGHLEIRGPVLDPLILDRHFDKWRKGSRRLTEQAGHYGVRPEPAHNAMSDAIMAARIAWVLVNKHLTNVPTSEWNTCQGDWYQAWAVDFSKWLASKGEPPKDTCWPFCEGNHL